MIRIWEGHVVVVEDVGIEVGTEDDIVDTAGVQYYRSHA